MNTFIVGLLQSLLKIMELVDSVDEDKLNDKEKVLLLSKIMWIQGIAEQDNKEIEKLFPKTSPELAVKILIEDFEEFISTLPKK